MKFNICIWDVIGFGIHKLNKFLNLENIHIVAEVNNIQSDQYIELNQIGTIPNVDYYLVVANGCRNQIEQIFRLLELNTQKILYFDVADYGQTLYNWYQNEESYLIFRKTVTKYFDVFNQRQTNKYLTCTAEGLSYIGDVRDNTIMFSMYINGIVWASDTMHHFYSLAKKFFAIEDDKEGIFCDIGANIGTTCTYFKKKIDTHVKILAFEPSKDNFKMLRANLILNDIDESEVTLVPMGVSDVHSQYQISYSPTNPGATSLNETINTDVVELSTVTAIPFDDYLKRNHIDINQIKYIWVDTEGFEGAFLNGAKETLHQINVPIVLEFTPDLLCKNHTKDKFLDTIEDLYASYIIMEDTTETLHPVSELRDYFASDCDTQTIQFDIFMLKSF